MIETEDKKLLTAIQFEIPLVPRPYARIARRIGQSEPWVLDRVKAMRDGGIIREISGIFDVIALGYRQVLAAFEVAEDRLDQAGEIVSGHPGVSHCYGRAGKYNLWFTLAVSPQSSLGLEGTIQRLADQCGAAGHLLLPTIKRYKLKVDMTFLDESLRQSQADADTDEASSGNAASAPAALLSEEDARAIRALQIDLPCRGEPFMELAQSAGVTVERLLVVAVDFKARGLMRRYAAVPHHRAAGAEANVMVAWRIEPAAADIAGARCAVVAAVSHCYLRPTSPNWPYNFYTMIHGRSRADCELAVEEIAAVTGMRDRCELWTQKEYKKRRMRLLDQRERQWEERSL